MSRWVNVAEYARVKGLSRSKVYWDVYTGKMDKKKFREVEIKKKKIEILLED